MKLLHFVDTAGTDERFVAGAKIKQIAVTAAVTVIVYMDSLDPSVTNNDRVELTVTSGFADEVALTLAQFIAADKNDVLTVEKGVTNFEKVTAVAYSAGA